MGTSRFDELNVGVTWNRVHIDHETTYASVIDLTAASPTNPPCCTLCAHPLITNTLYPDTQCD